MMHPKIHENDPFREVNWREERVIYLLEAPGGPKRSSAKYDDSFVRKYRSFLLKWQRDPSAEGRQSLFPRYPELYHVQKLRERQDAESQAVMEARILSGASNQKIAYDTCTSPQVVRWYEKLFFDVRERLDRTDYIRNMVITPMFKKAASYDDKEILTEEKLHAIYKMMAYVGGPVVLDFILWGFKRESPPSRTTQLQDWCDNSFDNMIRQQGMLAMQAFSFNKFTVMQLLEMCRGVVESAAEARRAGGAATEFTANVEHLIRNVNLTIGRRAEDNLDQSILKLERSQIEPRAEDYEAVAKGQSPEGLQAFEAFERPEPTPKEV